MSIAIPTGAPSLGKSSEDGPGFTIVGYFRMKQTTRDILRRITADDYDPERREVDNSQKDIVNGVKLWERVRGIFCRYWNQEKVCFTYTSFCTVVLQNGTDR